MFEYIVHTWQHVGTLQFFKNTNITVWLLNAPWRPPSSDWSVEASWLWRCSNSRCGRSGCFFFNLVWLLQLAGWCHSVWSDWRSWSWSWSGCEPCLCGSLSRCRPNTTEPSVSSISLRNCRGGPPSATQVCKQNTVLCKNMQSGTVSKANSRLKCNLGNVSHRVFWLCVLRLSEVCLWVNNVWYHRNSTQARAS